jgi:hypothetical protein
LLGKAFADQKWTGSTIVILAAGWKVGDRGKAKVTMSTKRVLAIGNVINDNNSISFTIDPSHRPSMKCSPSVAVATVASGLDGKVTITIPK